MDTIQQLQPFLEKAGVKSDFVVTRITQEASNRNYFRISLKEPFQKQSTLILCSGLKTPYQDDDHFVQLSKFFLSHGIDVPEVFAIEAEKGWLLLNDLGTESLYEYLLGLKETKTDIDKMNQILCKAVDLILKIQELTPPYPVSQRILDSDFLYAEMEFLISCIENACDVMRSKYPSLTDSFISFEWKSFIQEICSSIQKEGGFVFTHRDYHSRNLFISKDEDILLLDFQDARWGSHWNDLSSLLYDPYSNIPSSVRKFCLEYYLKKRAHLKDKLQYFQLQSIQRLLKALGTYIHQCWEKKNLIYMDSIPITLELCMEITERSFFPDSCFFFLQRMKRDFLPAFQEFLVRSQKPSSF